MDRCTELEENLENLLDSEADVTEQAAILADANSLSAEMHKELETKFDKAKNRFIDDKYVDYKPATTNQNHVALALYTAGITKFQMLSLIQQISFPSCWTVLLPSKPVRNKDTALRFLKLLGSRKASNVAIVYFGHGWNNRQPGGAMAFSIDANLPPLHLDRYLFPFELGEAILKWNPNVVRCYYFFGACFAAGSDIVLRLFNTHWQRKGHRKTNFIFLVRSIGVESKLNFFSHHEQKFVLFDSTYVSPEFVLWNFNHDVHNENLWSEKKFINVSYELKEEQLQAALDLLVGFPTTVADASATVDADASFGDACSSDDQEPRGINFAKSPRDMGIIWSPLSYERPPSFSRAKLDESCASTLQTAVHGTRFTAVIAFDFLPSPRDRRFTKPERSLVGTIFTAPTSDPGQGETSIDGQTVLFPFKDKFYNFIHHRPPKNSGHHQLSEYLGNKFQVRHFTFLGFGVQKSDVNQMKFDWNSRTLNQRSGWSGFTRGSEHRIISCKYLKQWQQVIEEAFQRKFLNTTFKM